LKNSDGDGHSVVASPQAAKGIQAVPGRDLMVPDSPHAFAEHVLNLLQSSQLRERLAESARRQVEGAHMWQSGMASLDNVLAEVTKSDSFRG
jgi:glycosyltransferase involved in cell wall biosynthesis